MSGPCSPNPSTRWYYFDLWETRRKNTWVLNLHPSMPLSPSLTPDAASIINRLIQYEWGTDVISFS